MKVISFSLWGDDKLYCQGAIENVKLAAKYYPDYTCRFYASIDCPALSTLAKMDCEVIVMDDTPTTIDRTQDASKWHMDEANQGMLWRFLAIDDPTVTRAIFRDCDSRIGPREVAAVREWEESGMIMHRMHECKEHWNAQVMGGMWGVKPGPLRGLTARSIEEYLKQYRTIRNEPWIFVDLWWIMDCIWPTMSNMCMGHGYNHPNKFKVDGPMVGGVVNEEWRGQKYE